MSSKNPAEDSTNVGLVAGVYALLYSSYRDWLRASQGGATRSMASALVCIPVLLIAWNLVRVFDQQRAFLVVPYSRSLLLLAVVMICAMVDWLIVQNGKADKWAIDVADRWPSACRYRGLICAAVIMATVLVFFVPTLG